MGGLDDLFEEKPIEQEEPKTPPLSSTPPVATDFASRATAMARERAGLPPLVGGPDSPPPFFTSFVPRPTGMGGPALPPLLPSITASGIASPNRFSTPAFGTPEQQRGFGGFLEDTKLTTPFSLPAFTEEGRRPKSALERFTNISGQFEELMLGSIGLGLKLLPGEPFEDFQDRNERSRHLIQRDLRHRILNPTDWFNTDRATKLRESLVEVNMERSFIESVIADIATLGAGTALAPAKSIVRGSARAAVNVPKNLPTVIKGLREGVPKIQPSVPSVTINKARDILKAMPEIVEEKLATISRQRGTRGRAFEETAEAEVAAAGGLLTETGASRAFAKLKGPLTEETDLFGFVKKMTSEELDELRTIAYNYNPNKFEKISDSDAFHKLFMLGKIPEPADLRRLENIFGTDFIDEMIRVTNMGPSTFDKVMDALNIPRAILSSADISAAGRQGRLLGNSNPREFKEAFKNQLRALTSERHAQAVTESIMFDPRRFWGELDLLEASGVSITERIGRTTKLVNREEAFMTSYAQKIPIAGAVIRASERGHVTFLNKLRADVLYKTLDDWRAAGKGPNSPNFDRDLKRLGEWINIATGRGPLPGKVTKQAAPALNALFFSPRLNTSRIAAPLYLTRKGAMGMASKDLAAFASTNMGILALMDIAPWIDADINLDPRSSDFGKARIGPTRFDFWGGFQQYGVTGTRIALGETTTGRGEQVDADRLETILRFLRFKLAPVPGLGVSLIQGQDPLGRELDARRTGIELFTPLAIQSVIDGIQQGGINHGLLALPEVLGISVQSYQTQQGLADKISFEMGFNKPYNELDDTEDMKAVMTSAEMIRFQEKAAQDRGDSGKSAQEDLSDGMRNFEFEKSSLQTQFKKRLEEGVSGETLRNLIQDLKQNQHNLFQGAVSEQARDLLTSRRGQQAVQMFQDRYWNVELTEQVFNGQIVRDYNARDDIREGIIKEAAAVGISKSSVTARSDTRFIDEQVKQIVEEYERDMETLRFYWDIPRIEITDDDMFREYQTVPQSEWSRSLKRKVNGRTGVTAEREKLRRRSRTIDNLLLKWGFVTKSIRSRR
jgi:hypothetical protein